MYIVLSVAYIAGDVDADDLPQFRAIRALSSLITVLSKKDKKDMKPEIYVIEEYPVSTLVTFDFKLGFSVVCVPMQVATSPEDADKEKPSRNSPRIGRFAVEDGMPLYFIFIEQQVLCQCSTLCKTLLIWFSVHYVFNLQYHKYYHNVALFLQEFVFDLPEAGKKSSSYLSIATELSKVAHTK